MKGRAGVGNFRLLGKLKEIKLLLFYFIHAENYYSNLSCIENLLLIKISFLFGCKCHHFFRFL
jgi:hypothetical protein